MHTKIQITSSSENLKDLMLRLNAYRVDATEYTLKYKRILSRYRGAVDTGVLIAVVGLAGTGLAALITGIFTVLAEKHRAYVEISGKDWSFKGSASMPAEERDRLIEQAKTQGIKKIEIIGA